MNIIRLSLRNMISRPLSTSLSLILFTLGVGMIALLLQVNRQIQEKMENNIRGIDMVVGAKGSPLQLVLSAVYHIDAPTGNIPLSELKKIEKNKLVKKSIPLSYGDSYEGYRILGTTSDYINLYKVEILEGVLWQQAFEVTLGWSVANELNLSIGDEFAGQHGLAKGGSVHDEHKYRVIGILQKSNSVIDQLILTSLESVWDMHQHKEEVVHHSDKHNEHADHDHDHEKAEEEEKDITAAIIKFRNPIAIMRLPRMINENTNMQAAVPNYEISRLFGLMGVGLDTMINIAYLIMFVSALSIFISLYNALKDRRYEMALIRTYGGSRWQLVSLVLLEGMTLSSLGFAIGLIASRLGIWLISGLVREGYHYELEIQSFAIEEFYLLLISLGIGLIASIIPAVQVFRINISKTLADA